jgi:hypothetical protein
MAAVLVATAWVGCAEERESALSRPPLKLASTASLANPPPQSGRLVDLVAATMHVRDECRPLRFPSDLQLATFRTALRHLLRGELEEARWLFGVLGFELLELVDGEVQLIVVKEVPGVAPRGWGLYAVNLRPSRPLVLEAPHPQHDRFTGEQTADLAVRLGARALILATTHRCASKRPTSCWGRTGACRQSWGRGRYRRSDRAHITRAMFHAAHAELLESDPGLTAVQIHGFSRRPARRRHFVISDGTRLPGRPTSRSNRLARAIRALLPRRKRRLVRSCNETSRQRYLCGTHNVQGRHANGSPDPCRLAARRSLDRFVQIEQSLDARTPGGLIDPEILPAAMARVWPLR